MHFPTSSARSFWVVPLWVLAAASLGALQAQTEATYLQQKRLLASFHVSELLESWVSTAGIPGAVIALVEGDATLVLAGFGVANLEQGGPVDPVSTVFPVGELVRPLTTTAVLQLAERARIALDKELSETLGRMTPPLAQIGSLTAEQLLLHTAGLDQRVIESRARTPAEILPLETYLDRRLPPPVRTPGLISVPSSFGYALAGLLVEKASGDDFSAYLEKNVFRPLGMTRSTVAASRAATGVVATGYRQVGEGFQVVTADYPQTIPASFLLTTGADQVRWLKAVLNQGTVGDQHILNAASVDLLLTQQFANHPSLPGRTLAFREGRRYLPSELYLASVGNGFSSVLMILPHKRIGLFVALNCEADFWGVVYKVLDYFDTPQPSRSAEPPMTRVDDWSRYTGYWRDATTSEATAEKLLSLVRQDRLRRGDDDTLRWQSRSFYPLGPEEFRQADNQGRLCFVGNSDRYRFAASDRQVLARLSWFESRPVQATLWVCFATIFLAAAWSRIAPPGGPSRLRPVVASSPVWPAYVARLAAALQFVFIVSLAIFVAIAARSEIPGLLYEIPSVAPVILALPWLAGTLTFAAVLGLVPVWRSDHWSPARCWLFTVLTLALMAFLPFLESWKLLGFHL